MTVYNHVMRKTGLWTIDDLSACVALALAADYEGSPNGQVRDVPDLRTIRYYTTLGLIDRPAEMHGRTALYGRKHLMQLAAIKRLQARGMSLAEIQQRLVGLGETALAQIARLPADLEAKCAPVRGRPVAEARSARRQTFWKEVPRPAGGIPEPGTEDSAHAPAAQLQAVRLDGAAVLSLATSRPIDGDDIEAIRIAAAPLLKRLEKRRLLGPRQKRRQS